MPPGYPHEGGGTHCSQEPSPLKKRLASSIHNGSTQGGGGMQGENWEKGKQRKGSKKNGSLAAFHDERTGKRDTEFTRSPTE